MFLTTDTCLCNLVKDVFEKPDENRQIKLLELD